MSAPDLIEAFIGWKGLDADSSGQLFSPSIWTPWPAGEALVAQCSRRHKTPPVRRCHCGIYALKDFEQLVERKYNWREGDEETVAVIAEVALWGGVIVATDGYRAERAYPRKVYVSALHLRFGSEIRRRYGCEIGLIDRFTGRRI
jgi:hypothetical protein